MLVFVRTVDLLLSSLSSHSSLLLLSVIPSFPANQFILRVSCISPTLDFEEPLGWLHVPRMAAPIIFTPVFGDVHVACQHVRNANTDQP